MGCCFSLDQGLLSSDTIYDLQPYTNDTVYGPCYIGPDISRMIRANCIAAYADTIRVYMRAFPQLHYQIGAMELARERFYRGPNNIRFVMDENGRCKLVLFG